ncbi:MAG: hypothetical protein KBC67_01500 [Candidatus Pacebacteria bacterium]|nr:hypothetical protein [Candidatus Paceibacterota bacterium]
MKKIEFCISFKGSKRLIAVLQSSEHRATVDLAVVKSLAIIKGKEAKNWVLSQCKRSRKMEKASKDKNSDFMLEVEGIKINRPSLLEAAVMVYKKVKWKELEAGKAIVLDYDMERQMFVQPSL